MWLVGPEQSHQENESDRAPLGFPRTAMEQQSELYIIQRRVTKSGALIVPSAMTRLCI